MLNNQNLVCTTCGFIGKSIRQTKGSTAIELILWLMFLFPGLIYSIWRLSSRQDVCPQCKNPSLIPADSPMGQKLVKELPPEQVEKMQQESHRKSKVGAIIAIIVILLVVILVGVSAIIANNEATGL